MINRKIIEASAQDYNRALSQIVNDQIDQIMARQKCHFERVLLPPLITFLKGGKKVRPITFLSILAATDQLLLDDPLIQDAAAALEIAHRATLVTDDIADADLERNGLPALHKSVGFKQSLFLASQAQAIAIDACPDRFREILIEGLLCTFSGQSRQEAGISDDAVLTFEHYREIVDLKSSGIGRAALKIAAAIAGDTASRYERKVGNNLALGFQILNDVSDIVSWLRSPEMLLPRDLASRSVSFPLVVLGDTAGDMAFIRSLTAAPSTASIRARRKLKQIIEKNDVLQVCRQVAYKQLRECVEYTTACLPSSTYSFFLTKHISHKWPAMYLQGR